MRHNRQWVAALRPQPSGQVCACAWNAVLDRLWISGGARDKASCNPAGKQSPAALVVTLLTMSVYGSLTRVAAK